MQTQADLLGITAERWQEYAFIAGQTDIPVEKLHSSMIKLNQALGAYRMGIGDERFKDAFKALRITPEDLRGIETRRTCCPCWPSDWARWAAGRTSWPWPGAWASPSCCPCCGKAPRGWRS